MILGRGLRLPSPWVPAESVFSCPRHNKKQLYAVYGSWKKILIFMSLIASINKDIYQQEKLLVTAKLTIKIVK
jgi:hypothetical protein